MFLIQCLRRSMVRMGRRLQLQYCRYAVNEEVFWLRTYFTGARIGEMRKGNLEIKLARRDTIRQDPIALKTKMLKQWEQNSI
jgi:hypothetical protein